MENKTPGVANYSPNTTTSNTLNINWSNGYYTHPYYQQHIWYQPYQQIINYPITPPVLTRPLLSKRMEVHITSNKSRTKLFGSNVYMPDNTEFEIELFNPSNETLGVKFKMNGEYISDSMLVLYPGKRLFLDRYLNENKKFKYVTYTVDDNKESKDAIANNGNIQVEIYREQWVAATAPVNNGILYCSGSFGTSSGNIGAFTTSNNAYYNNTITNGNVTYNDATTDWLNTKTTNTCNEIETGMIAKGSKSDTEFNNIDMNFEMFYTDIFTFKILPLSQKPIEPKDLVRYCTSCSKKSKKDDKFCAGCGTKL